MSTHTQPTQSISRDNHYVPQMLLKRWSGDDKQVYAYRLLVSNSNVPDWHPMPIRGLAYQRNLYTLSHHGEDTDEFERWFSDIERLASEAIDKVVQDSRLKREDWHNLARFFALQDVRTPASFFESMIRWEDVIPGLLDQTLKDFIGKLEDAKSDDPALKQPVNDELAVDIYANLFKVTIDHSNDSNESRAVLRTEVPLGRKFWLAQIRDALTRLAEVLCEHKWSITEPAVGEWPLTDHPAVKLNFHGPGKYDFGGGWGRQRTDLFMPLSPNHLLFVEVGKDLGRKRTSSYEETRLLQRFLVERAHRWVFATRPVDWIPKFRRRKVDQNAFEAELDMWERWHAEQTEAEISLSLDGRGLG